MSPFIVYVSPAPLLPHFRFFRPFTFVPLLPAPSPTIPHLLTLFSMPLHPCLIHPTLLPLPVPPLPLLSLFDQFMNAFLHIFLFQSIYTCTYMIYCIEC